MTTEPVELGGEELNRLVKVQWITQAEADSGDRAAIAAGISNGIRISAKA
jgi:hypothetical protein